MPDSSADALEAAFARCRDLDASLNEQLAAFANDVRRLAPPFADSVDRLIARLQQGEAGAGAPQRGDSMPPFLLPDHDGHLVGLGDLIRSGPLAVTFHRGHWCPYCRISIKALADVREQIENDGGQIIAIMPERQEFAAEFKSDAKVGFPILTDMDNGYAMSLNLAVWLGDEMQKMMTGIGRSLPAYQGNDAWMVPIPATFVVGADGRVKARFVDPDYRRRMAIDDLLAALRGAR
jgi:peroxiredoxin